MVSWGQISALQLFFLLVSLKTLCLPLSYLSLLSLPVYHIESRTESLNPVDYTYVLIQPLPSPRDAVLYRTVQFTPIPLIFLCDFWTNRCRGVYL